MVTNTPGLAIAGVSLISRVYSEKIPRETSVNSERTEHQQIGRQGNSWIFVSGKGWEKPWLFLGLNMVNCTSGDGWDCCVQSQTRLYFLQILGIPGEKWNDAIFARFHFCMPSFDSAAMLLLSIHFPKHSIASSDRRNLPPRMVESGSEPPPAISA